MKNSNVFESVLASIFGSMLLTINLIFFCVGEYDAIEGTPKGILLIVGVITVLQCVVLYFLSSKLEEFIGIVSTMIPITGMLLGAYLTVPTEDLRAFGIGGYLGYWVSYVFWYITLRKS